jgi:glyoxylate/hydroxypyruvate reductase A
LRAIFALGAGVDQILRDPDFPREIPLFRLVDAGLKEQMAEYAIYGVLHHNRKFQTYRAQAAAQKWVMQDAVHPSQRTVGVMGLGVFGSDVAKKLTMLGFRVMGWSRTAKPLDGIECFAGEGGFGKFLARAEIVINLLPLTAETTGILSRRLFDRLPQGAALIHLGRGGHLVEADLLEALDAGRISWAMLDVFPTEPLPVNHSFWTHPNVMVTPHVAAQPLADIGIDHVLANLDRFDRGEPVPGQVNPAVGY